MTTQTIVHVDLSAETLASAIGPSGSEHLIIFWWRDCPIGQAQYTDRNVPNVNFATITPEDLQHAKQVSEREIGLAARRPMPSASVIVCTKDRPEALTCCLNSLATQTLKPTEVVVVDNGSADKRTREVAVAAGVSYVREDRRGLDCARNAGLRAAQGEIVAYTDDDVHLHPRWLERLVGAFDRPDVMAVTGLVLPAELKTEAQRHFETYWKFGRGYKRIDFGSEFFAADRFYGCPTWEIGAGANMAFRREIFAIAGPFDERLDVGAAGCSGDSEYWHRILSHGGVCRYEPSAVVYHYHRRELDELSSQLFHYMRGHAAALLVQFERTGNFGNLRRALVSMPSWYAQRVLRGTLKGFAERDRFLWSEIAGFASGILFYLRQPRPKRR
jgi:glycosyltransferase involved in cell wall biosynthesis